MIRTCDVKQWPELVADLPAGYLGEWSRYVSHTHNYVSWRLDVWEWARANTWCYSRGFNGSTRDDCYEEFSDWLAGLLSSQPVD